MAVKQRQPVNNSTAYYMKMRLLLEQEGRTPQQNVDTTWKSIDTQLKKVQRYISAAGQHCPAEMRRLSGNRHCKEQGQGQEPETFLREADVYALKTYFNWVSNTYPGSRLPQVLKRYWRTLHMHHLDENGRYFTKEQGTDISNARIF